MFLGVYKYTYYHRDMWELIRAFTLIALFLQLSHLHKIYHVKVDMYQHINIIIYYGLNQKYLSRCHQRWYPRSYLLMLLMSTQNNSPNKSQIISSLDRQRTHIIHRVGNTYRNPNLHFITWRSCNINSNIFLFIFFQWK